MKFSQELPYALKNVHDRSQLNWANFGSIWIMLGSIQNHSGSIWRTHLHKRRRIPRFKANIFEFTSINISSMENNREFFFCFLREIFFFFLRGGKCSARPSSSSEGVSSQSFSSVLGCFVLFLCGLASVREGLWGKGNAGELVQETPPIQSSQHAPYFFNSSLMIILIKTWWKLWTEGSGWPFLLGWPSLLSFYTENMGY